MNKSNGNVYEFVDARWNPVKGKCLYQCSYCYVGRWGQMQNPIHLDSRELRRNLGGNNFIFVCSGCDLFHPFVPWDFITEVFRIAREKYPENTYLWHTKNPARAIDIPMCQYPKKSVLCVTMESNWYFQNISEAPRCFDRVKALKKYAGRKMITIEPIIDFHLRTFSRDILACEPEQVNIGADSGNNYLPEPSPEKIAALIEILRPHTRVHLKKNLARIYKG
jgi:protein gp37